MLLKNWFNYKYLLQNIKKSKSLLALLMGLLPLINTLIFLLNANSTQIKIATLTDISWLNYVGVYIYPVVLAIALLGYTFKHKQIDFIGSMPINRKTIFSTNIIGGVLILASIMVLNVIFIGVASLFFPNMIVAPGLLWDYFIFWTISYIFVFMVTTLAISIASNTITTLVVTALILFLVPFIHDYIYNVTGFINNYIAGQVFTSFKDNYYTVPYSLIATTLSSKATDYNLLVILKMFALSIAYFGIGRYLFIRKQFEVNETSFRNFHLHTIIKCLTMIPFGLLFYEGCTNKMGLLESLLFVALVAAYYFIYDLITRKQISRVLTSLIYFSSLLMFTLIMGSVVDVYQRNIYNNKDNFILNNIKSININVNDYYLDNNKLNQIYTTDSKVISYFVELYKKDEAPSVDDIHYISFKIVDKENNKFNLRLVANSFNYNRIINAYLTSDELNREYAKISNQSVILAKTDNQRLNEKKFVDVLNKVIKKADANKLNSLFGNDSYGNNMINFYMVVNLYMYDNHKVVNYAINPSSDIELMNYLYKQHLKELKEFINKIDTRNLYVRVISKITDLNFDIGYYSSYPTIKDFINEHINDKVDFNKPYIIVRLENGRNTYYLYSNATDEFSKLYDNKKNNGFIKMEQKYA